jgi:hypothetical protein
MIFEVKRLWLGLSLPDKLQTLHQLLSRQCDLQISE